MTAHRCSEYSKNRENREKQAIHCSVHHPRHNTAPAKARPPGRPVTGSARTTIAKHTPGQRQAATGAGAVDTSTPSWPRAAVPLPAN
jgi:hypothetical protein